MNEFLSSMLFTVLLEMSNYLLSIHVNFAARKSSLKNSQRVADHIMQSSRGAVELVSKL